MAYIPTQEDLKLLLMRTKRLHCRIDLLDQNMKAIDSLEGITIDGSIDIDADSDIRRTYSSTLALSEKHAISRYSEEEWINKYVRIYLGIERADETVQWYSMGLFTFNQNGFSYNQAGRT